MHDIKFLGEKNFTQFSPHFLYARYYKFLTSTLTVLHAFSSQVSLSHTNFSFFFFNLVDCSSQVRTCTICSSFRRNFFLVAGITFDRITGRESRGILVCHDPGLWASESCNNLSNSLHPPTNGEIWKQFFTDLLLVYYSQFSFLMYIVYSILFFFFLYFLTRSKRQNKYSF